MPENKEAAELQKETNHNSNVPVNAHMDFHSGQGGRNFHVIYKFAGFTFYGLYRNHTFNSVIQQIRKLSISVEFECIMHEYWEAKNSPFNGEFYKEFTNVEGSLLLEKKQYHVNLHYLHREMMVKFSKSDLDDIRFGLNKEFQSFDITYVLNKRWESDSGPHIRNAFSKISSYCIHNHLDVGEFWNTREKPWKTVAQFIDGLKEY